MPTDIVRHQTPEEVELLRKRQELAAVRAELAERELELADLRAQLKSFEGRYLREVGVLYAELDEWEARIAEVEASLDVNPATAKRATEARERATESYDATHGEASHAKEFQPSADLKRLFREVAKCIHPDFATDDTDRKRRHELMAQANEAYSQGDSESLQSILKEYRDSSNAIQYKCSRAEILMIIRQIDRARKNLGIVANKIAALRSTEIGQLKRDADLAQDCGRDLLGELASALRLKIRQAEAKSRAHFLRKNSNGC